MVMFDGCSCEVHILMPYKPVFQISILPCRQKQWKSCCNKVLHPILKYLVLVLAICFRIKSSNNLSSDFTISFRTNISELKVGIV